MAGFPLLVVLVVLAAAGAAVAVQVVRGRVRSGDLPLPVAAARARGTRWSAAALLTGLGAVGALGALAVARRSEALVLLAPLTGAGVHAVTALLGELTWPRPGGRVRSARLVARSIRASAPAALLGTAVAAALLVLAACVAGTLLAGAGAQTWTWRTEDHAAGSQVPGGAVAL
ncbi:hypothetical protein GTQ99_22285, partial [Kineococcus sp. T13]